MARTLCFHHQEPRFPDYGTKIPQGHMVRLKKTKTNKIEPINIQDKYKKNVVD